jgi:uncharacterized iron-regulated membrane protein
MHSLRLLHRWAGILVAVPIVLVALTGGLLLFKDPYFRWRVPRAAQPMTVAEVARQGEVIGAIAERFAVERVRNVKFPRDGMNVFHVYLGNKSEAFVDPADARVLYAMRRDTDPAMFIFDVHAHLLGGVTGELVNGYLACVLMFFALTGIVLWWPSRRRAFHPRRAAPRAMTSGELLRSHAASGIFLAAPLLLFAATGAGLVFYQPLSSVMSRAFDRAEPELPSAVVARDARPPRPWTEILESAVRAFPEARPRMMTMASGANAVVTFRTSLPGEWHPNGRSYTLVDPYTAAVVQKIDAREQGAGTRAMHALYPLHAAMTGGVAMVVLALVTAFGTGALALGGFSAWWLRARRTRLPAPRTASAHSLTPHGSRNQAASPTS